MQNLMGNFNKSPKESLLDYLYENKVSLLEKASNHFVSTTSLVPKIGLELEFYLINKDGSAIENQDLVSEFILDLSNLTKDKSLIYKIEQEQGIGQIEIKTLYDSDLLKICHELEEVKILAQELASKFNIIASFAAQPFLDDCGSALQFNISLHNKNGDNLFEKEDKLILNTVTALLHYTDSILILLARMQQDFQRFDKNLNLSLYKKGKYTAPVNLSFGFDNRTCAIRIPSINNINQENQNFNKRVEYRIAAANSDPYLAIASILLMSWNGIKNDFTPDKFGFSQIFGNAFDTQYNLKSFANSYENALDNFLQGNLFNL